MLLHLKKKQSLYPSALYTINHPSLNLFAFSIFENSFNPLDKSDKRGITFL